ncbi:MAG: GtrA family protein [Nanoarchaeota archaeon]
MIIRNEIKIFSKYIVIALFATIIDLMFLFVFTEYFKIHYLISATISYILGGITHYTLNKKYTFKNKSKKIALQLIIFFFVSLVGLLLNKIILYSLVEYFMIWYVYAKLVSIMIIFFWNFIGHKFITFRLLK